MDRLDFHDVVVEVAWRLDGGRRGGGVGGGMWRKGGERSRQGMGKKWRIWLGQGRLVM